MFKRKDNLRYIEANAHRIGATIKPVLYKSSDEVVQQTRSYIEVWLGLTGALILDSLKRAELNA